MELPLPQKVEQWGTSRFQRGADQGFHFTYVKFDFAKVMARDINLTDDIYSHESG